MLKGSKNKVFLIIIILVLLLLSFKFLIPYFFDKTEISSIDQSNISFAKIKNESNDVSLNQAKLESIQFASSGLFSAKGNIELRRIENHYYIIFNNDFSIINLPDLYVYLYEDKNSNNFDSSRALDVGKLKSSNREQAYEISEQQYKKYSGEIIIWCKLFSFKVAEATLN